MSFILDALRKVDRESHQSAEIVPPVAAVEKLRKERVYRRRQFAAMAVIAIASAAATALLLREQPPPREPAPTMEPAPQAAGIGAVVEIAAEELPAEETEIPSTAVQVAQPQPEPPPPVAQEAPPETEAPVPVAPVEAVPPSDPPRLVLQGTSVLDGRPVAVVSDRRVFEGDTIEGATVIRIEERSVELEFEGKRFTLTL